MVRPVRKAKGFTLIELMVVLTIIALLLSLAVPRYFKSVDHAREATLRQNLQTMREAIDKYYGDNDKYPASLEELVKNHYLKAVPIDPLTDSSDTWLVLPPEEGDGRVFDVKSGAAGKDKNGKAYIDW